MCTWNIPRQFLSSRTYIPITNLMWKWHKQLLFMENELNDFNNSLNNNLIHNCVYMSGFSLCSSVPKFCTKQIINPSMYWKKYFKTRQLTQLSVCHKSRCYCHRFNGQFIWFDGQSTSLMDSSQDFQLYTFGGHSLYLMDTIFNNVSTRWVYYLKC